MAGRDSPGMRRLAAGGAAAAGRRESLRIATFNLESLDESPRLAERIACLRRQLLDLDADILCLQEVNAQKPDHGGPRRLSALDALLADTPYARFHRVSTAPERGAAPSGIGVANE